MAANAAAVVFVVALLFRLTLDRFWEQIMTLTRL